MLSRIFSDTHFVLVHITVTNDTDFVCTRINFDTGFVRIITKRGTDIKGIRIKSVINLYALFYRHQN